MTSTQRAPHPPPRRVTETKLKPLKPAPRTRRFSTQDTRPVGERWCDPLQLVDGHWSADGCALALADVAGQWHLYAIGQFNYPGAGLLHDQFLAGDYAPLLRDGGQHVLDADTQQPPHVRQARCAAAGPLPGRAACLPLGNGLHEALWKELGVCLPLRASCVALAAAPICHTLAKIVSCGVCYCPAALLSQCSAKVQHIS